jgi:hypothetical protein
MFLAIHKSMTAQITDTWKTNGSHRQTCKVCGCPDKFDFHVPDSVWNEVVPREFSNRVVCLGCFDKFAYEKRIDYAESLDVLYFAGDRAIFKFETVSAKSCKAAAERRADRRSAV